jgi:hypothetical protein
VRAGGVSPAERLAEAVSAVLLDRRPPALVLGALGLVLEAEGRPEALELAHLAPPLEAERPEHERAGEERRPDPPEWARAAEPREALGAQPPDRLLTATPGPVHALILPGLRPPAAPRRPHRQAAPWHKGRATSKERVTLSAGGGV